VVGRLRVAIAAAMLALLAPREASAQASPEARLDRLEERLRDPEGRSALEQFRQIHFSGYLQPQMLVQLNNAAASPNADANGVLPAGIGANSTLARADGTTTNGTYFRLRRARLKAEVTPSDFAQLTVELEPFPKGGPGTHLGTFARNIEAIGIARLAEETRFEVALGEFNLPFGSEIMESNPGRPFIDSSYGMGSMFPGDFDLGLRGAFLHHGLTVMASVVNGVMLGEPGFSLIPDPNRGKDVTFRVDYDFGPLDVGASAYVGSGSRTDKTRLVFVGYRRWALNGESTVHTTLHPALGALKVVLGLTLATNMDRGVSYPFALPDFPATLGAPVTDKRELAGVVRVEEDMGKWLTLGVRYDYYSPDLALDDNGRHGFAAVGAVHFTKALQAMLEYGVALDHTHASTTSPTRQVTDMVSTVLQARF
jgi:hypothetical protein